jgi:hypothetical protein
MRKSLVVFLLCLAPLAALAQPPKPKLVVGIVVDQMRADYLTRFLDLYGEGGFKRLMTKGAMFTNCNYIHSSTSTAPGHSTFLSGISLRESGIIANEWYSVPLARTMYCVEDESVSGVGVDPKEINGKMSPKNFNGTTVCDELTKASPASKTFAIAIKDRGSILPGGQHPTGVYWFDVGSGNWITSTYYAKELPQWIQDFNARKLSESYLGKEWTKLLPDSAYARAGEDNAAGEGTIPGEKEPVFPHKVNDLKAEPFSKLPQYRSSRRFDALLLTPYGNDMTIELAKAAIDAEKLGQRDATDILSVSFSSPDYCGHAFGPDSHEMEDMMVRLDRQLEGFFKYLDDKVGLDNVTIVLTADHAVSPLPEKFPNEKAERLNSGDYLTDVKVRVGQQFNYDEGNDKLIITLSNDQFYLNKPAIKAKGFSEEAFENAVGQAVLKEGHIATYYTRTQLEKSIAAGGSTDYYQSRVERSFNTERSGDVSLITTLHSFFWRGQTGTTHGTPYEYDTHVPLLFYGVGVQAGTYNSACAPNDISATLASLLGISKPAKSIGNVLTEALTTNK